MSLLLFVVDNRNKFKLNYKIYHINTRQKCNSPKPLSNLSLYQEGVYSIGTKVPNSLPQSMKNLSDNPKQFQSALKNYLYSHSQSVDE